jgi:ABC-type antimicrobial peptide transport system permease subunit
VEISTTDGLKAKITVTLINSKETPKPPVVKDPTSGNGTGSGSGSSSTTKHVKTGDVANVALWIGIFAVGVLMLVVVIARKKSSKVSKKEK